tara:strand:+ start:517 stop:1665 length:1149 start_codon:yes stop_codon:yes gene_type:complete
MKYRIGLAESLMSGQGFSYNGYLNIYQTPVYPFFLSLIFTLFGKNWLAVLITQSILDCFSCVWISKISLRFSYYGIISGMIFTFYPYSAAQCLAIIPTSLFTFLLIGSIYYFFKFDDSKNIKHLFLSSFFLSIGILNRPSIIFIPVVFILFICFNKTYNVRKIFNISLIILVSSYFLSSAWLIRNYYLSKKFPVFAVAAEHTMWYSHNTHTKTIYERGESPDIINTDTRYLMSPNIKVSDFFKTNISGQLKLAEHCRLSANDWLSNNFEIALEYSLIKFKVIFGWEYFPSVADSPFHELRKIIYRLSKFPIVLLGWLGIIIIVLKKNIEGLTLVLIMLAISFLYLISLPSSRHMVPLDSFLMIFSPLTIQFILEKLVYYEKT